ncbi:MAG: helix-turn-helix domain-containing protein [Actinobacteria bacterium]|nr:helix-turn-helix domain-containing protein [Actinomycetota bacterium]
MFEIGRSLHDARLRQQLDFPELEHSTKIRAKYLRALEEERFEVLPSHTYIKGFLRSYADSLGLDGRLYVDEYNSRFVMGEDEVPVQARRVPAARRRKSERRESGMVLLALTLIGVFTALVIAAWRFGGAEDPGVRGLQPNVPSDTGARPAKPTPAGIARVEVIARRGGSFVEVRRGSQAAKKPEFSGTIERGQKQRFTGKVLWLHVRTPKNVIVKLNGNRVKLPPAVKRQGLFLTAKRVFAAERA